MRKRCQSCGGPFDAQRPTALYCSTRCRVRESRKRAAGRPDAVASARPAPLPVTATRTVTLMVAPGVTVEVAPDVAAKLAAHLPTPGDPTPWGTDVRPRYARDREAGIDQALREAREQEEADQAAARAAQAPPEGSGVLTAADVLAARDATHPEPPDDEDAPRELSIAEATRAELIAADKLATPMGRNALMLAQRLDDGGRETGSALASLSREWRSALAAATEGTATVEDPIEKIARERRERMTALQGGA